MYEQTYLVEFITVKDTLYYEELFEEDDSLEGTPESCEQLNSG